MFYYIPKKYSQIILLSIFIINSLSGLSQRKNQVFVAAGYGLAGSFFVRSYEEFNPNPGSKVFYKKNFLGVSQNGAIGINLRKNWEAKVGINYQHFTRKIKSFDVLNNVIINLDHDIHHRDYMWYGNVAKKIDSRNHLFLAGIGVYYLLPKQEEVEIVNPIYFSNEERDQKNSNLNELGSFLELGYEYKFQRKVYIGIKTQFYYTLTSGYAESITLFPYVKLFF